MQKTNMHRLQKIAKTIENKMRSIIDLLDIGNPTNQINSIKIAEPVQVSDSKKLSDPYTTESTNPTDMYDPYSTR